MYSGQPRRTMPPYPPRRVQQPMQRRRQAPPKPSVLAMFRGQDGKFDFNKISDTAQQVSRMYSQVRPLITTFIKK